MIEFKGSTRPHEYHYCGKPVGYVGRLFGWFFGLGFHGCKFTNVRSPHEGGY